MRMSRLGLAAVSCLAFLASIAAKSIYDDTDVHVLKTVDEFDAIVLKSDTIWMVVLYAEGDEGSVSMASNYKMVGGLMKGIFGIGAVDVNTAEGQKIARHFDIDSIPSLYLLSDDKGKPTTIDTRKDIVDTLVTEASTVIEKRAKKLKDETDPSFDGPNFRKEKRRAKSSVIQLDAENFEEQVLQSPNVVAVAFTAPWCGHCARLKPEFEEAAERLVGTGGYVAWIDGEVNVDLAMQYGVKSYPTIKIFPAGLTTAIDAIDYVRERNAESIVASILVEVDKAGIKMEIPEMTGKASLEDHCGGKNHICVVAALPHILDSGATGRNKYIDALSAVATKFRGNAYSFMWYEGLSQPDFETTLELTFGFPAVVALSLDRQAFALLQGSFAEKSLTSFVNGITSGTKKIVRLDRMPSVVNVEPWDGSDGAPVEEEFSLEDIMGDEL